jgi:putative membrane-bound dehydrogenase-like protein
MNSLRWGLDNKIYGAAAGNGGSVRHADRPDDPLIQLTRRDFCFDPVTEKIEAISGGERYGACFDDWGNRFLCNIRNPVQHVVLPLHYLARNPYLVVPSAIHDCAESGDQLRVYRLSPPEAWREFRAQRWALEQANMPRSELIGAGFWTSSSGVCVYRGSAYPEEFRGNVFIGEVAGNLVHRQILTRDGVTFKSRRADENTEFVRSRDNWFRPVNFVNAPDGTLTVLDMYRETIEHPWSIPDDIKAQLDLSSGKDRGRLYRLVPPKFTPARTPKLSSCTTAELVSHLESPHSWYRETAQRLLFERQDKSAVEALQFRVRRYPPLSALGQLHALYALSGLNALTYEDVATLLNSGRPELKCHALCLAERFFSDSEEFASTLYSLASHSNDQRVGFQAALTAGAIGNRSWKVSTLVEVARDYPSDPWNQAAVLSSASGISKDLLSNVLDPYLLKPEDRPGRCDLVRRLAIPLGEPPYGAALSIFETRLSSETFTKPPHFTVPDDLAFAALAGLGEGLSRQRITLHEFIDGYRWTRRIQKRLDDATAIAIDRTKPLADRLAAFGLLRWFSWTEAKSALITSLQPVEHGHIQLAGLRVLGSFNKHEVARELLAHWKQLTPPLRDEAITILLSRPIWHEPLIAALERGDIPPAQVSIPQRTRLVALKDPDLAERAKKVLASVALGPRKEIIDRYQEALTLKGDGGRGQIVYRRECASCHRLHGEGTDVGPSLETVQHRSPQEILIHVLDPNREVSPNFLDYTVRLVDGRVLTGMIAAETDAGLTLRRAQKQEDSILRSEIEEITSSGKSLMPEGMEQKITEQEMADLIFYLRQK